MDLRSGEASLGGLRIYSFKRPLMIISLIVGLLLPSLAVMATAYVYDSSGRLVAVSNDAGAAARYSYDAIGNLTDVDRFSVGQLAVFTFTPSRGAAGATVRIKGQGFSATAAQNTVTFNGAAATVTAASATELMTSVPATATTGPVTVTVGSATASSQNSFVVDANASAPMITAASPTLVTVGQSVVATGTRLLPIAGQTSTLLNGRPVTPSNLSDTQISFPVPKNAGSGKVTVTTPLGVAISPQDVVVVPTGVLTTDIESTRRLTLNAAAQSLTVSGAGKSVAVLYDVATGEYPSLQFSGLGSSGYLTYSVYGTNGALLASSTVRSTNLTVHLPPAGIGGTFMVLIKPSAAPVTFNLAVETARVMEAGGPDVNQDSTIAYQSKRMVFTPAGDKNIGLGIFDLATPNTTAAGELNIYAPDGSLIGSSNCQATFGGCQANLQDTVTGTYSAIIEPPSGRAMSFKAALSIDKTAILTPDVAQTLELTRRGENGRLLFDGTAGQLTTVKILSQSTTPAGGLVYYSIYGPNDALLASTSATGVSILNVPPLPATGTYTVLVDSRYGEQSTAQLLLTTGSGGAITVDGNSGTFSTAIAGQVVYIKFNATAGQNLGIGISDLVTPGSTSNTSVDVYRPDGARVGGSSCDSRNCEINLSSTAAGTYLVQVTPTSNGERTLSFKATVSTDVVATLEAGVTKALAVSRRGQNGRLQFSGIAGQSMTLQISGQVTSPTSGRAVDYSIYTPLGASAGSGSTSSAKTIAINNLSATGTYTVLVDPQYGQTMTAQLLLQPVN